MSLTDTDLGTFADLARALGILRPDGQPNPQWFSDPVGAATPGGNDHGLRHILADDAQRDALLAFVDAVLGPPDRTRQGDAVWVPLFRETTPQVTVYAVVEPVAGAVRLGIGLEHATAGAVPRVATRLHVPLFQLARGSAPPPAATGGLPGWLLLGRPGGRIAIGVDLTLRDAPAPAGQAALGRLALTLGVPTAPADPLAVALTLGDLQLPGAPAPRTFALDAASLDELGPDVLELVAGLVRAQADALDLSNPLLRPFAALTGLLGLRDVPGLPPLPLAALASQGVPALVAWLELVLASSTALTAWLGQLVVLTGGTVDAGRAAVTRTVGPVTFSVGVRVGPGTTGHPVLTPWVELALTPQPGARVRLAADLLRADTGGIGSAAVIALPDFRAEAVFGADAGGPPLRTGDPAVASVHVGIALTADRRPTFVLTLDDVTVAGRHHDRLDLSSPNAALDSADAVLDGALASALASFGPAGALAARLLGIDPPAGVPAFSAAALLADPVGAIATYWRALAADRTALATALAAVRPLLVGAASAAPPGAGTPADPWRLDLASAAGATAGLHVWTSGSASAPELTVAAALSVTTPAFGDHAVDATAEFTLLHATFATPPSARFGTDARATLRLRRADNELTTLALGSVALEARSVALALRWTPNTGFGLALEADALALLVAVGVAPVGGSLARIDLPLPTLDATGRLAFTTPPWDAVEQAIAALASTLHVPILDLAVDLLGWDSPGPRLSLAALVGADPSTTPAAAVERWLADLLLDCARLRAALGPVATLLSGFTRRHPLGSGSERAPYRCPVAGHPRAPALTAWLDPGCPPVADTLGGLGTLPGGEPPELPALVADVEAAAQALPDVADLLVGRPGLARGLATLIDRWAGTDGLTPLPATLPTGVTAVELPGHDYARLVALGSTDLLLGDVLDPLPPGAVVYVGCEPTWTANRPAGTAFDATAPTAPAPLAATGAGPFFVRLPTPTAAATARPDRGAVGEQAARLTAILAARTDPVTLVAYGPAGAAALRAALTVATVGTVVTVGTPWTPLAVDSLQTGTSGDALRFLDTLRRPAATPWPDALYALESTPLETLQSLVPRARTTAPADLPSAAAEPRRPGLAVHAVFGTLDADTLATGLAALCTDGLAARLDAARAAAGPELPHTALHVGVDVPVLDLDLAGLLVGLGAGIELAAVERTTTGVTTSVARAVRLDVHLGVTDGWLVGGPGAAQPDIDCRWLSAHVTLPLDGRPGTTEFVLHEARAFSVARERWTVRAGPAGVDVTGPVPEVRLLLSAAVTRLRAASAPLAALLDATGLTRNGGLDPAALDRLLYDPAQFAASALTTAAVDLAGALRALVPDATGSGSTCTWTVTGAASGPATAALSLDLATGTLTAAAALHPAGAPPLTLALTASRAAAGLELTLGTLDPLAGGVRLVAAAVTGSTPALRLDWQPPGQPVRPVPLLPAPDTTGLQAIAASLLPAALTQGLAEFAREAAEAPARAALDAALDTLGMLSAADAAAVRRVRLPLLLFTDPGAWLRQGTEPWRTNPVGSAVALLDAATPLVAPAGATPGAWPVAPGATVRYASDTGRLRLTLDLALATTVGTADVITGLVAGLSIAPTGAPAVVLEAGVAIDGRGLQLRLAPSLRVDLLRPAPATPLQLYPSGPGLGDVIGAVGETVLPPVLEALAAHRTDTTASIRKDVGTALFELGGALDLLDAGHFTGPRLTSFAADPGARFLARLPHLAASGTAALARALDPAATVVRVTGPTAGLIVLEFGATRALRLTLDGAASHPALVVAADFPLPGVGHVVVEELRLSVDGLQLQARIGPADLTIGALTLRPFLVARAGTSATGFSRLLSVGLAFDPAATDALELRWTLDGAAPALAVATRDTTGEHLDLAPAAVATRLLALAASLAGGIAVGELRATLPPRAVTALQGVVFTDAASSTELDPALFLALLHPPALLLRLERLLWNLATAATPLSLTLDGIVTLALVGEPAPSGGGRKRLGVALSLAPGRRFTLAAGDPTVELEVDASWIDPATAPGLSIFAVEGKVDTSGATFAFAPTVRVAGLGLRFGKPGGPLLSLGPVALDAIALHLYGEASAAGVGGGVHLELGGLAVTPGGMGGSNAVASSILNDAGASSPSNRPAFSPSLAVQHHPGQTGVGVSLRAGPPPGPWYVVVQRQLGPLYVERVGFDTAEQAGRVSRITLLFDGRVSLFGLTAAVDGLSLSWLGGDVFQATSWAVDLNGLAVSADMSGVSLAGGLLKTTVDGNVGYVGMLLGRFGVYGLSVFGGYTTQNGSPSFFIFGALNGPIGGPPAFFLTGIGGGLGINRGLKVPTDLARFNEYPFIQALDPAARVPEPMEKLRELTAYFPPQPGNFWFAAGISFTSFALVDGIAVVAVSFGDGLEINLLGLARMALPRPQAALVSIELGLLARFSTREGLFSIQAQLTENSWLLYEDVRLTGGFAFVTWWKGPLRGQFVLTIGGYHPSFHRDGYPEVPRLGLVWRVSDEIVIKGGAYFALTSEALMAGVDVEVSADFGWAWARISFGAHGIVFFDPFWFEVTAYARIAAGVKISTWLGTIRFGISMGASIRVWGPDFSGEATLEVGPCSFTVGFGSEHRVEPRVLGWGEFTAKYLEEAGTAARALSAITGRGTLPSSPANGPAAPTADGSRDRPFEVFAEFELSVVTTIPTHRFDLALPTGPVEVPVTRSDGAAALLGLKPMQAGSFSSTLRLTLERLADNGTATSIPNQLRLLAAHREPSIDAFPIGAWGAPELPGLPAPPLPKGDVLFAANGLRLEAVATQMDRGPEVDYYRVEAARRPLPLQAGGTSRAGILTTAAGVTLPAPATAQQALAAARAELFAPRTTAPPPGLQRRGEPSNLARAAYAGDRTAPPLFGTLADGLAQRNAADGSADHQPPPALPAPGKPRRPRVTAWFAGGTGVRARDDGTTVADGRLKRRPAPTLVSVQTRLALHLPVQLVTAPHPAADQSRTAIPVAVVPHTGVPGAARAYVAGRTGGVRGLDALVGGLARTATRATSARAARAADPGQPLAAGDLVALTLPDAVRDTDPARRPTLELTGAARVVMVRGDGVVLDDRSAAGGRTPARLPVPPATALVGVQADGRLDVADGLAGWHEQSRVAALGSHLALGAGCVLAIEAASTAPSVGWCAAADIVRGAAAVTTRFAAGASLRTVVVVLAEGAADRLDDLALDLRGARRARAADGSDRPPVAVLIGDRAALVYAVDPLGPRDPVDPTLAGGAVAVGVRAGGDWQLAGVLAGAEPADSVARRLAERGVVAAAGRVLAADGAGCQLRWIDAPDTAPAPGVPRPKTPRSKSPAPVSPRPAAPRRPRARR